MVKEKKRKKSEEMDWLRLGGWVTLGLVLVWALMGIGPSWVSGSSLEARAMAGDSFGAVAALFSGLATAGVVIAILMQRKELELQRQELRDTRNELVRQTAALSGQWEIADRQVFNSLFFELVGLHNDLVESSTMVNNKGREAFGPALIEDMLLSFREKGAVFKERAPLSDAEVVRERLEVCAEGYAYFHAEWEHVLGQYFRSLFQLVSFVDASNLSKTEKAFYMSVVRGQLSSTEIQVLMWNLLVFGERMKPLVLEYQIVQESDIREAESLTRGLQQVLLYQLQFHWRA